jgi:uncharacterized protein YbjT (DUF2867 family)/uncharacterized membrane protein YphA (DoxX/SURF4 family)
MVADRVEECRLLRHSAFSKARSTTMKILLTGATGFIGSRLHEHWLERGHELVCPGRRPPRAHRASRWVDADFARWTTVQAWRPHLDGIDAVVNTVGIFRERGNQTFEALHVQAPQSLFSACAESGVRRVVQLSALGAQADAPTAYLRSKRAADAHLLALGLDAAVAMPSLVFGPGGASTRWFLSLAALPLLPLPAGGGQRVQPVHVDDVVQALTALVEAAPGARCSECVALVGPQPLTLAGYLQALRHAMRLPPAPVVAVPGAWVAAAARAGDHLPGSLLDSASWTMLQRGSVAPAEPMSRLLGRAPRPAEAFITHEHAASVRAQAQMHWLLPVLRLSIAAVWIVTGIVSLGVYPVGQSYELLARTGVPQALQPLMLYGAAALDLAFGVLTLSPLPRRRWLWLAQAVLMAVYMVIIAVRLPEYWLHPFGPLTKNLPMLAALLVLYTFDRQEERAWST